jgi:hypothetical protein
MSVRDQVEELRPQALLAYGFDAALLGIAERADGMSVAAYDREKCVGILMRHGMGREAADKHLDSQVMSVLIGEHMPVFVSVLTGALVDGCGAFATAALPGEAGLGHELLVRYAGDSFVRMAKPVYTVDIEAPGGVEAVRREAEAEVGAAVLEVVEPALECVDEAEMRLSVDFMCMSPRQAEGLALRCYEAGAGRT